MQSIVLIPGASGTAWSWHLVEAELGRRGYDAFAVDLPAGDEGQGLDDYANNVVDGVGDRSEICIVAHSLGAFTAPLVWQRVPTEMVVFVNAMIPLPGETPGQWWDDVGSEAARIAAAEQNGYSTEFDLETYFLHDVPSDLAVMLGERASEQSDGPFGDPCRFEAWPDCPVHVVASSDDRFFPLELQRRIARDRLGIEPDVIPGGHLALLSRPRELSDLLAGYLRS